MLNTDYKSLKNDRQWRACTGLKEVQFEKLSQFFEQKYIDIFGKTMAERQSESQTNCRFKTPADLLFFLLFCLKSGLGQDSLGFIFGINGSNVSRNRRLALRILQATLNELGLMPKREFSNVKEFEDYFKKEGSLIIDGTEQMSQRPQNKEGQKDFYSGKKNSML